MKYKINMNKYKDLIRLIAQLSTICVLILFFGNDDMTYLDEGIKNVTEEISKNESSGWIKAGLFVGTTIGWIAISKVGLPLLLVIFGK